MRQQEINLANIVPGASAPILIWHTNAPKSEKPDYVIPWRCTLFPIIALAEARGN